eukprot:2072132-Prymnesium_polylepis.1
MSSPIFHGPLSAVAPSAPSAAARAAAAASADGGSPAISPGSVRVSVHALVASSTWLLNCGWCARVGRMRGSR